MLRIVYLCVGFLACVSGSIVPLCNTASGALVLDDTLQGSTQGTREGGAFVAGGWRVTGKNDTIYWHVPTISYGAVEFDVRGLNPNECRAGMEDKSELFHMYDWTFGGNGDINYNGGYRDTPYKHFIRKTGCADTRPGKLDSLELLWQILPNYTEPDSPVLSWNTNITYRFREEWGPSGGNSVIRTYRDGVLLTVMSMPGSWNPPGHSVRIAASPRRDSLSGAPLGAIFSNVKVWNLANVAPGAPVVTQPVSNAVVNTTLVYIQWNGSPHARYQVRVNQANNPDLNIAWDSGEVSSDRNFVWTGSLANMTTNYVFVRLGDASVWGPWSAAGHRFRVDTASVPAGTNFVRVNGKSLRDNSGPFLGFGASYFTALRRTKYDRARLTNDLVFLASKKMNYVRTLSMVGWYEAWQGLEIAPVSFNNRVNTFVAAWPDYWQQFRDMVDIIYSHGMRAQVTIFADAQLMPSKSARTNHMNTMLQNLAGREHKVILLEVANEAWQNGFPGAQGEVDLREFAQHLGDRTQIPVAITSNHGDPFDSLYAGSAADIATWHFSRDIGTVEGGWLPVRDCYSLGDLPNRPPVSSNEPIGPGSSVNSENDPIKLVMAAAFAWTANLPMYVFHSSAGVFGHVTFQSMAGVGDYVHLPNILPPDLSSWVRNDGKEASAPFTAFANGQANKWWPEVASPTSGVVRNTGAAKGEDFITVPIGTLSGGVTLQARRPLTFQVYNPLTGVVAFNVALNTGSQFTLPQGPGGWIIKGKLVGVGPGTCGPWDQFLDGSIAPSSPWQSFHGGGSAGTTTVVNFFDSQLGVTNQALRVNSTGNANEWFVGLGSVDELGVGARFRLVALSPVGKENLLCLTTHSTPMSPAPAITLVNSRYKLWSYVDSNTEIMDLGPVVINQWHTAYLYARNDGKVRLWWDGALVFDGMAPLVNAHNAFVEWGSGAWQYDATTTVDFDWLAYGHPCNLPQLLEIARGGNNVVVSWLTNATGYVLQSSGTLSAPNWIDVTNGVTVSGENYTKSNPLPASNQVFRLRKL